MKKREIKKSKIQTKTVKEWIERKREGGREGKNV